MKNYYIFYVTLSIIFVSKIFHLLRMLRISVILLFICIFINACQKKKEAEFPDFKVKGGYTKMIEITYTYNDKDIDEFSKDTSTICYYDSDGNRIKKIVYSNGSVLGKMTWLYNNSGNLVEFTGYTDDNTVDDKHIYFYDDRDSLIRSVIYEIKDSSVSKRTNIFNYDKNGNEIQRIHYNNDGSVGERKTYSYDDDNNKVQEVWYIGNDSIKIKISLRYDNKGNNIEKCYINANGSIRARLTYCYDSKKQSD
jgi:hypothetical protein